MAGLEALAMGIPLLAADNRGTREYMEHGRTGFVCPPGDAEGFLKGIEPAADGAEGKGADAPLLPGRGAAIRPPYGRGHDAADLRRRRKTDRRGRA